jgi:hypothetical protein
MLDSFACSRSYDNILSGNYADSVSPFQFQVKSLYARETIEAQLSDRKLEIKTRKETGARLLNKSAQREEYDPTAHVDTNSGSDKLQHINSNRKYLAKSKLNQGQD